MRPLEDLTVLDLSRLVAGGMLTTVLADFGAEVIKVEQPGRGDPMRAWTHKGEPLWWKVYARNKKSITLNLADPKAAAKELVESARAAGRRISGFGHRTHGVDPRQAVLFELARRHGIAGNGVAFVEAVRDELAASGRALPINVDGAIAAILFDLGLPSYLGKVVFILGRVAGVAAHVVEELSRERPMRFRFPFTYDGPGASLQR